MRSHRLLIGFGVWTLFVWATRVFTAIGQDDLSGAARMGRVGLALSFTLLGAASVAIGWAVRNRPPTTAELWVVRAGAWWTAGVWTLRGVDIALGDHDAAFVVVHLVLAVVSMALAVPAERATTMRHRHGTTGHRRTEAHVAR